MKDDKIVLGINTLLKNMEEGKRKKIQKALDEERTGSLYSHCMSILNQEGMDEEKIFLLKGLKKID